MNDLKPALFQLDDNGEGTGVVHTFCSIDCRLLFEVGDTHFEYSDGMNGDYIPDSQCDQCGKPLEDTQMNAVNPNLGLTLNIGDVICERGNTWIYDDEGNNLFLAKIDGQDKWLEISIIPNNYPGFNVKVIEDTQEKIVERLHEQCDGWYVGKCNLTGLCTYSCDGRIYIDAPD